MGFLVGLLEVGLSVGSSVSRKVGCSVGRFVEFRVGFFVGNFVGFGNISTCSSGGGCQEGKTDGLRSIKSSPGVGFDPLT